MPPLRTHGGFFDRVSSASSQPESSSENGSQVPAATSKSTFKHKRRSITTSWIWNHGTRLESESESESETKKRWRCNYCPLTLSAATTSNASTHLRNAHGRTEAGKLPTNQTTLEENESKATVNSIVLRKLIVEWIIDRRHSFNEVEAESFRKIIEYIDKAAVSKLPHSHNTIRSDCLKYFNEAKGIIREHLSTARSKIHLSSQSRHTGPQMTTRRKRHCWLLESLRRTIPERILQLLYMTWQKSIILLRSWGIS